MRRSRGQRGNSARGRGRERSRGAKRTSQRNGFTTSRVKNVEEAPSEEERSQSLDESAHESLDDHSQSASEDDTQANRPSYATLLQTLNARQGGVQPPLKRRKLQEPVTNDEPAAVAVPELQPTENIELAEAVEEEVDDHHEIDSDDDEFVLHDPFERHFATVGETQLGQAKAAVTAKKRRLRNTAVLGSELKKVETLYDGNEVSTKALRTENDLKLKRRLSEAGSKIFKELGAEELDLMHDLSLYKDIQCGARTVQNVSRLRDMACLHALNHVFKTRDRVLKNNSKASQHAGDESIDLRDQGFTRPKVLVIVPTKQACANFIDNIAQISDPDQQENKSRFLETYSSGNDDSWHTKPADFKELFGGNHEEDFRVGLKFTRKTIKYFSGFYNSDIIFGSALGLMRTITTGGGGKDKKKTHDADFLSSIEIVIVDNASAIQMQNWQHLEYVFTQLNLLPKESHGCDFSRVRNWYLDGNAKFLRQTVLFTAYHTPEINALFSTHTFNISGSSKYTPRYSGAMLSLPPSLPFTPSQTFLRFDSPSPHQDADARFTYFTTSILPSLLRQNSKGILIFIPTYADFTRLRNHFSTSPTTTSLSFGSISEYTPVRDVARARSHFMNGRHSLLIYSERAHHHFRYKLKGVRRIVFYGIPENPIFWTEVVGMLGLNDHVDGQAGENENNKGGRGKGTVRALFSRWDLLKLERVVGSERVGRLVAEKGGDTFEFV